MHEVKVKVVEFGDRPHYQMQYVDPLTRRKVTRSTKVNKTGRKRERTEAERVAAKWEAELREGRYASPSKVTWAEFRRRYEDERLSSLASRTDHKVDGIFNSVEEILNPQRLRDVTAERLSYYQSQLRTRVRSEATIKSHLAHLQAALRWAVRVGLAVSVPSVEMPKRAKTHKMKGRPITTEEFERMLGKVVDALADPSAIGRKQREQSAAERKPRKPVSAARREQAAAAADSWRHLLHGLWCSGLRLGEAMELYWDRDDRLGVEDLDGRYPMLRIPAELEKGHKDRLLPMAPEFAEFLRRTPPEERTGPVFTPQPIRVKGPRLLAHRVGEMVSKIGEAAGVKVATDATSGKVKFASAHDLRRSFGERWSSRVMPMVLKELMRHESIETTMKYYVGSNAKGVSQALWDAHRVVHDSHATGNTFGNRAAESSSANKMSPAETRCLDRAYEVAEEGFEPPTRGL